MDPDWGTAEELGECLWQPHVYGTSLLSAPEEAEIEGNDSEQESDGEADMAPGFLILSVNEKAVSHLPNSEIKQCLDEEPLPVLLGLALPTAEPKRDFCRATESVLVQRGLGAILHRPIPATERRQLAGDMTPAAGALPQRLPASFTHSTPG
eukprot:TRINITY_DN5379_c0_g1_i2.p1 TRINITY_DN5379_c0_g1~~TRINITY_DN5379_c0_g1_i2.p1  ORF type:complete len:152 (-),score=34.13 TRINITY_DN5379_c0_g1_i2:53-508(-)